MYKKLYISIITLFICSINFDSYSQVFDSPQNPPSLRWKEINTKDFNIIYPTDLESEAQRMANTLNKIVGNVASGYEIKPKKIAVLLQNQSTTSNGFVQLAPRRTEFFTTPPQSFDYQDWLNSLAVHELRHVVQFDKLTGKFNAPLEIFALAIYGITLPPWVYEGDAVVTETALTNAGRGRQPEWYLTYRTNTLSNKNYSYSKDYLGSVKDLTPGYYQLGYFMNAKLRRDFGPGIMDSLFTRMAGNYLRPYNLSNSIKYFTGMTTNQLHKATENELKNLWNKQLEEADPVSYPALNKRKTDVPESYILPVQISGIIVLALKQSRAETPSFVLLDQNGKEQKLLRIGFQEEPHFSYSSGKIVWDESRYDKRYQQRSFNVVNVYDIQKKSFRQLTHRSRLFAPSLSPDGKIIAAIDITFTNVAELVELDASSGKELKRYKNSSNSTLQTPRFNAAGNKIVMVSINQNGSSIVEVDRPSGNLTTLLKDQSQLISRPCYAGNQIVFKAHYNGIDNLYRLDPGKEKIYQLTSAKFGAFNPSFDESAQQILFNDYEINGYNISSIPYSANLGIGLNSIKNTAINFEVPLVRQEGNVNVFDSIPQTSYTSSSYKEFSHLFNLHSIYPVAEKNIYLDNYNIGFRFQSDNQLNTLSAYAGYQFNNALKKSEYNAGFIYRRFYPVLNLDYTNRARLVYQNQTTGGKTTAVPVSWRENEIKADILVPFLFNSLNHTFNTGFKTGTSFTSRYSIQNNLPNFISTLHFPLHYQFYFNHNTIRSSRDLAPTWGQNVQFTYRHYPFENRLKGELLTLQSSFYFPGILKNHSFQTSFNYQDGNGNYSMSTDIPLVSGYSNLKPTVNLDNTLLFRYNFPLFYPDWQVSRIAYLKRIKGGFFADFENVGNGNKFSPRTFGASLRTDLNLLRFYLPNFDVGGKIIFVNEKPRQNPILEASFTYSY